MYKTILVTELIEDGQKLVKKLIECRVRLSAAVWFNDPDRAAWKLVIVTPEASNPGPLEAYTRIQSAMSGLNLSFGLDDILVMSPDSQRFKEFKRVLEGASGMSLLDPKASPGNTEFDDAYIYRW